MSAKTVKRLGSVYPIEETDILESIERRLVEYQNTGMFQKMHAEMQKKARAAVERPTPVVGIRHTTHARTFIYDPTVTVSEDLKDENGKRFYRKGDTVNPLDTVTLENPLVFIDGDDAKQQEWVTKFEKNKNAHTTLILVKGAPLELMRTLKRPIYFDQGGWLVKKLAIQQVPAVVTQEQKHLLVQEVSVE